MNILIINQPLNNRGDESAHKALVRSLLDRIPQAKMTVLWVGASQDSIDQFSIEDNRVCYLNLSPDRYFNKFITPVMKRDWYFLWHFSATISKLKKIYRQHDFVICAPGGICMGGFQNWSHLFYLKIAQSLKLPIAYVGRSFGPFPEQNFNNKKFKQISLSLLNYFSYISFRDMKSVALANKLQLRFYNTVDTAFLDNPKIDIDQYTKNIIGDDYIVYVPNLLIWHFAYSKYKKEQILDFFVAVAKIMLGRFPEKKIVMLPQTFNFGNYENDDIHFFHDIANCCNTDRIVVVPDRFSSDYQQTIIRSSCGVVGARYHSVVFAINNNIPFVAFNYEHKIEGLLQTLNLQDYMINLGEVFDNSEYTKAALALFSEKIQIWRKNEKATIEAKSIAEDAFKELITLLKK